ncbi:hypothetical protein H9P43_009596 [Blastocladiella emersonii ATCC 22665]|nr:hypothetical protein H9P43_009596 [Blastocladiella emersonii ATCC 22665]
MGWCTSSAEACNTTDQCLSNCRALGPSSNSTSCPPRPTVSAGAMNAALVTLRALRAAPRTLRSRSPQNLPASTSALPNVTCTFATTLTECDLTAFMGGALSCPYCAYYLPYINSALRESAMHCPLRIAAFLAQVRHETQSLRRMWQPADNGAGALHLLPSNFPAAVRDIPALRDAVRAVVPATATPAGDDVDVPAMAARIKSDAAMQQAVGAVIARPEFAFRTAAWWFTTGAGNVLGFAGCGDLRRNADQGLGGPAAMVDGGGGAPSGLYGISPCIFGTSTDPGWSQRLQYYMEALAVAERLVPDPLPLTDAVASDPGTTTVTRSKSGTTDPSTATASSSAGLTDPAMGLVVALVAAVALVL